MITYHGSSYRKRWPTCAEALAHRPRLAPGLSPKRACFKVVSAFSKRWPIVASSALAASGPAAAGACAISWLTTLLLVRRARHARQSLLSR